MKKRMILALAMLLLLVGCANTSSNQGTTQSAERSSLRIGTMPALETFPIFIAYDQGFFEDEGLTVYLERFFNPRDRDIAFQTDENIDGMTFDLVQLAVYQEAGIDLVATTSTIGLAALIGGEGVYEIADLQGLPVLMTSNTSMDYILDRALTAGGLTMDDIITYEVPALPTRLEMLMHDQAAAAILPDPFSAMALEAGYNLVTTTAELGINPFVLAFRREITEEKLPELQAFYRAMNRAVAFLNTADREEFIDALLETVGYPEHVRDTLPVPVFPPYVLPTAAVVQDVLDFVRVRGLLTRDIAVEDIIFDIGN